MSETTVQFCRERRKDIREKIETIQSWIKIDKDFMWSFVYVDGKRDVFSFYGKEEIVDKNRLYLYCLVELMEWVHDSVKKKNLIVYTTNSYLVNCIQEWLDKWKRYDFKLENDNERPNANLLRKIDKLRLTINVSVKLLMVENEFSQRATTLCENKV